MSRVARRASVLAIVAFAAVAAAAAGANAESQIAEAGIKGDGGKVRLLFNQPGTNSFPPFVIRKFGLDKKYGFELQAIPTTTTPAAITAIQSGGADVGTFGWNDIARMKNAGVNVVGVAPFLRWGADFIVVAKNSPIQTLGDLKGKKVGVNSKTALNRIVMRAVALKEFKLDVEKESVVHEGAPPLLWGLLEQGQLDATHMFNSQTPAMVATGKFRVLAKISDLVSQYGLPDTPFLLYAFDAKFAAAHPNNVKAFNAAYRDAIDILMTDDVVWLERGKEMNMTEEVAALFRKEARTDIWSKFASGTEADIRKVFEVLLASAGPEVLGLSQMPAGFMTLDYQ